MASSPNTKKTGKTKTKKNKDTDTRNKRVRTVDGSCWECKQGRVKCSLEKPVCKRCTRLELSCDYSKVRLKWTRRDQLCSFMTNSSDSASTKRSKPIAISPKNEEDFIQKQEIITYSNHNTPSITSESFSPSLIDSSPVESSLNSPNTLGSSLGSSLGIDSFSDNLSQIEGEINTPMWRQNQVPMPEHQISPLLFNSVLIQPTNLPSFNQQLTYFKNIFLPKFHVFGNVFNLDFDQVVKDPLTNQLVVTLATFDMSHDIANSIYIDPNEMNKERSLAIKSFSRYLRDNQFSSLQSMFNSCVMLCILDGILEPQVDSKVITSTNHLFGARAIMRKILENGDVTNNFYMSSNPLYSRMLSIFNTMDLTYSILAVKKPFFAYNYWLTFAGLDCWFGTLYAGDPFLEILCKLSRVTELGFQKSSIGHLDVDSIQELNQIHLYLMDYHLPDYTNVPIWHRYIAAYAHVALLYYYRVINDLPADNEYVQNVAISFASNVALGMTRSLEHCLLFPFLVVGAHIRNPQQQIMIKNYIVDTYNYLNFSNLKLLLDCLEQSWSSNEKQLHEMTWVQQFEKVSRTSFVF